MSTDAKDVSRRFYDEIINQKNVDAIDRFCTDDFVDHNPPPGGKGTLDATKQQFLELVAAFPDLKMTVQDQIAEGDRVVNRLLVRGTHEGEYMGMPGSGKTVEIGGIDILRMVNGKGCRAVGLLRRHETHAAARCHAWMKQRRRCLRRKTRDQRRSFFRFPSNQRAR